MYGQECKKDRHAFFKDGEVENLWINVTNIGASETERGGRGNCHSFTTMSFKEYPGLM